MYCPQCGCQIIPGSRFCFRCGRELSAESSANVTPQSPFFPFVRDRSPAILTLGILAILFFGPFTGVPGWLMANQDLRDMRSGILPASAIGSVRTGRTLSIVGTFCSLLSLFLLFLASVIVFSFVMMFGEMFSAVL